MQSTHIYAALKLITITMGRADVPDGEPVIIEPTGLRTKYKIGKQIGAGNFAVVKECTEKYGHWAASNF